MEVHIHGSIGTGWGTYVKNLLGSMSDDVNYTFPKSWTSYWQFENGKLNGEVRDSSTVPISSILRKVRLIRKGNNDFPKLEMIRVKADLVHSNCRFLSTSTPYVLVFDTPWLLTTFRTYAGEPSFGRFGKMVVKQIALRKCAKILPFSQAAKNEFIRMTGAKDDDEAIEVLPPGVTTPNVTKNSKRENHDDEFRLLFVGRNFDRKGGPTLLKSFEALASEFPNLRLTIKTRTRNITVPAKIMDRVTIIDTEIPKEDLVSMYVNSDLFVLPSIAEAFGLVCLEAMSYGLPVVASNHYALPEIVEDGITGYLFEKGSTEDLSKKLRILVRDPGLADRFGVAGLAKTKKIFSNEVVNARLLQIYKSALD